MAKKPMTKKQQMKAGIRGATKQYDVGYRDTPNSEAVLTAGEKKKAKAALDDISNALKMNAGGYVGKKKGYNKGGYCGASMPPKNPVKRGKS